MNTLDELQSELSKQSILSRFINQNQLATRCAFCGDSERSSYSTHMYVGFPPRGEPMSYYCQRCNVGGFVNDKFFKQYEIYNLELRSEVIRTLRKDLKKHSRKSKSSTIMLKKEYRYNFDEQVFMDYYGTKIEYLNSRCKCDMSIAENLVKYRVVLSPYNFLKDTIDLEDEYEVSRLLTWDHYYVGFLTNDGSRLVMRCMDDESELARYHHITMFATEHPVFYSPTVNVDLESKIKINLAEGIFDIINLNEEPLIGSGNTINVAVLGKDYATKIQYLIEILGSVFKISEINIYSDSEVKPKFFKYRLKQVYHLRRKIKIFRNVTSKDYGDKNKEIILTEMKGIFE